MREQINYFLMAFMLSVAIPFLPGSVTCKAQDNFQADHYNTIFLNSDSVITLPLPDTTGGRPLMQCLKDRKTTRSFTPKPLSLQLLSNLLWAAFGINRSDGRRTAPSAMNWQEISLYVAMENGLYLYEPQSCTLKQVLKDDVREKTGIQQFVKIAPVDIVYVADLSKATHVSEEDRDFFMAADCGFIAQNVYLFCASEGLGCVVRGSINRSELSDLMHLRADQRILLSQTVGYSE
jgi:SagB-type dehydrogenase family enzyme